MKSALVIFVILMNLYILVQATELHLRNCRKVHDHVLNNIKQISCNPKETFVKLPQNDEYKSIPDHVLVKRCDGRDCVAPNICKVVNSTYKEFHVQRIGRNGKQSCHAVDVEEHTNCECGCNISEKSCNDKQIYMNDACKCVCKNMEEMDICKQTKGMMWDEKECKCKCNYKEPCSYGSVWIPDWCMCGKLTWNGDKPNVNM